MGGCGHGDKFPESRLTGTRKTPRRTACLPAEFRLFSVSRKGLCLGWGCDQSEIFRLSGQKHLRFVIPGGLRCSRKGERCERFPGFRMSQCHPESCRGDAARCLAFSLFLHCHHALHFGEMTRSGADERIFAWLLGDEVDRVAITTTEALGVFDDETFGFGICW